MYQSKYKKFLQEAKQVGILYHFTESVDTIKSIIDSGKLKSDKWKPYKR